MNNVHNADTNLIKKMVTQADVFVDCAVYTTFCEGEPTIYNSC
jgi:hypothetical protein